MKKKKLIWQIPFLLILIIGSIFVIRQQRNTPFQKDEGMVFGTIYHITYQSDTNYQKEIEAELQKVDNSLSPFNKTSIISRINRNEKVKVDEMFSEVFQLAEKISGDTDGAFDITVAPLGITKGGKLYRDGEGITIGDIAARYSMSESAVKSNLHRTRLKLKSHLEQEGVTV